MDPKLFFESKEIKPQSGTCFILMPFAAKFNKVYSTIREVFESDEITFTCKRADDIRGGGHVMESVLQEIGESEIIIADLTGSNPNVFYELGITHMVKNANKVILLTQDIKSMPFDLNSYRSIVYKEGAVGAKKLKSDLQNAINAVSDLKTLYDKKNNPVYQFAVEERKIYKFPIKLFGENNCLYDFEIYGDYFGGNGVKFTLTLTIYVAGKKPSKLSANGFGMSLGTKKNIPKIPWLLEINKLNGKTVIFQLSQI
jgi:hypothetical protein